MVKEVVLDGLCGEDDESVHGAGAHLPGGHALLVVVLSVTTRLSNDIVIYFYWFLGRLIGRFDR